MSTLQHKLLRYRDASDGNEYIVELTNEYSVKEIIVELENMLRSDSNQVIEALFFLRQVSIFSRYEEKLNQIIEIFRREIPTSLRERKRKPHARIGSLNHLG